MSNIQDIEHLAEILRSKSPEILQAIAKLAEGSKETENASLLEKKQQDLPIVKETQTTQMKAAGGAEVTVTEKPEIVPEMSGGSHESRSVQSDLITLDCASLTSSPKECLSETGSHKSYTKQGARPKVNPKETLPVNPMQVENGQFKET